MVECKANVLYIKARESTHYLNDMVDQLNIFASMDSVTESLQKFCRVQLCASLYLIKEAAIESDEGKATALTVYPAYKFHQQDS